MSRFVQCVTPENIEISYELAGIGSRFVAALVDHMIQVGLWLGLGLGSLALMGALSNLRRFSETAPLWVVVAFILLTFAIVFGYHVAFELRWAGQTPGKRLTGLRVVRDGGYPIDPYSSIVRNLVRIVDLMPFPYGIGLASVFFSSDYKRLGDYAAGTIVIKEREVGQFGARGYGPASPLVAHFMPLVRNVDMLSLEEFQAIHRFVARRHELEIPVQAHLAMRLALPLKERLGLVIDIPIQWHYADLLEAIERRYVEERGLLAAPWGDDEPLPWPVIP